MSYKELIAAARATRVDEKKIAELRERLQRAEEKFRKEAKRKAVTQEFLDRTYTL